MHTQSKKTSFAQSSTGDNTPTTGILSNFHALGGTNSFTGHVTQNSNLPRYLCVGYAVLWGHLFGVGRFSHVRQTVIARPVSLTI